MVAAGRDHRTGNRPLGVFASLFFFEPFLANPMVILARLNNDEIPVATLTLMASFVPILFCKLYRSLGPIGVPVCSKWRRSHA